jgi:hypothetical protein
MDTKVPLFAEWGIQPLPGGVRVWHIPCGQYRSFHQGAWIGLAMDSMTGHTCPPRPEGRPAI